MPAIRFWALYDTISRLEAMADLRTTLSAAFGANPGKDGGQLRDYTAGLQARIDGRERDPSGAYGLPSTPASALRGPHVRIVEGTVISSYRQNAAAQVQEQIEAWKIGGWPELQTVLERQRAYNLASL